MYYSYYHLTVIFTIFPYKKPNYPSLLYNFTILIIDNCSFEYNIYQFSFHDKIKIFRLI